MSKDFSSKQPAPEKGGKQSRSPKDQGRNPSEGIVNAPLEPQDRGGAGPAVPPNRRTIR